MDLEMETICQAVTHGPRAAQGGKVRCTSRNPIETLDALRHRHIVYLYVHVRCATAVLTCSQLKKNS